MFAKFKLQLQENEISDKYKQYWERQNQHFDYVTHQTLDKYLLKDGRLDAYAMEKDWFPKVDANVFISHSHADKDLVMALAGFLYHEYEITSFIDSTVWGYANDLLEQIDDKYSVISSDESGNIIYSYERRNRTTSQVYLLLQGALTKMIDKCECLIFVNTPNVMQLADIQNEAATASPWIYSEVLMASNFPARPLKEYRTDVLAHSGAEVIYHLNLIEFVDLNITDFAEAKKKCLILGPKEILDQLYRDKQILSDG